MQNVRKDFFGKHRNDFLRAGTLPPRRSSRPWHFVAEGSRVASLSRVKGYKEETTSGWLQQAAEHATQVENVLMSEYEIERGQLDALWSYVGCKEQESEEGEKRPS